MATAKPMKKRRKVDPFVNRVGGRSTESLIYGVGGYAMGCTFADVEEPSRFLSARRRQKANQRALAGDRTAARRRRLDVVLITKLDRLVERARHRAGVARQELAMARGYTVLFLMLAVRSYRREERAKFAGEWRGPLLFERWLRPESA